MFRWLYVLLHLLHEAASAHRYARIRFLKAQVEILRRKLGGNRVIPSPDDRLRLLAIGAELKHDVVDVIGIVTPQTYSRWVVDQREGRNPKPVGRPKIARNLCELVKRFAKENAGWGYRRIIGELRKLRLRIGRSSVRRILKEAGLTPSPYRRGRAEETVWRKFIRLHLNTLVACDFFTKSVITPLGARLAYCLVFMHVGTRKVFLSPPTYEPNDRWVQQQGRNLLMWLEENNLDARFLLRDRDSKFSFAFDRLLFGASVRRVRIPLLAPDANAFAESWIGSFKRECLDHFACFSLGTLTTSRRPLLVFTTNSGRTRASEIVPSLRRPPGRRSICRPRPCRTSVASAASGSWAGYFGTIRAKQPKSIDVYSSSAIMRQRPRVDAGARGRRRGAFAGLKIAARGPQKFTKASVRNTKSGTTDIFDPLWETRAQSPYTCRVYYKRAGFLKMESPNRLLLLRNRDAMPHPRSASQARGRARSTLDPRGPLACQMRRQLHTAHSC